MKRVIILFVGTFTLFSCSNDEVGYEVSDNATQDSAISSQYSISEEEALANLYAFMGEGGDSRSSDNRVVSTVLPVKYGNLGTRAIDGIDCENLLYIANFENEAGYAVLAGDTRIEDEVIAIIDEGSLEPEVLNHLVEFEPNERTYYDEYPMTGPSFYTTPETGNQLILNPNTADLYIAEEQDTLVGNFTLEEDSIGSRSYSDNISSLDYNAEHFALSLTTSYAMRELIEFDPNPRDDGDDDNDHTRIVTTTSSWQTPIQVLPILDKFKYWGQSEPFNNLYIYVYHPIKFWLEPKRAAAGCFPLAIAKLMTHYEIPFYKSLGITIDYAPLKTSDRAYLSDTGSFMAEYLLVGISLDCDSWTLWGGTFTFPHKAEAFMSSIGFNSVERRQYDFDNIQDMLDDGRPIIVMSIPRWHPFESHAWNIDGYKIRQRTTTIETYINDVLHSTETKTESKKMVHCDFGWHGVANGYYVSGVFDLDDPNIEHDPYGETDSNLYYKWYLRFIYYDIQNENN